MPLTTVFIGLGSNIEPEKNLMACAEILRADYPGIMFSSVYKTAARDEENQADFLNAVAKMETEEAPEEVQITLRQIETDLGKDPPYPKGPRTIDLDILLFDDLTISRPHDLTIPHPRMHERRFVMEPLCELSDPDSLHPVLQKSWKELVQKTKFQSCTKLKIIL